MKTFNENLCDYAVSELTGLEQLYILLRCDIITNDIPSFGPNATLNLKYDDLKYDEGVSMITKKGEISLSDKTSRAILDKYNTENPSEYIFKDPKTKNSPMPGFWAEQVMRDACANMERKVV